AYTIMLGAHSPLPLLPVYTRTLGPHYSNLLSITSMNVKSVVSRSFSTAEAARLTGLSPRQLDHWDRQGFLRPTLQSAAGYGSSRRYSFARVVRPPVAARLRANRRRLSRGRRRARALAPPAPPARPA